MALISLMINEITVEDFEVTILAYDVKLPLGTTEVPTVDAISNDENEVIEITPPESLPGETIITVTLAETTTTYKINFTVTTLLDEVKNYLDITWADTQTDLKLQGIIERGKSYLNRAAGKELDFNTEDKPKELLFDYCRYVRSNALEMFQQNYLHELLSLQIESEVDAYEAENPDTTV